MTAPRDAVYTCPDGTPFPVVWEDSAHAALTLGWNQSHFPRAFTPLAAAVERLMDAGRSRAHEEVGVPRPVGHRPWLVVNGFQYLRLSPVPADEEAARETAAEQFAARCGGSWDAWAGFCQPRIAAACEWLQQAPETTLVAALAERAGYAFNLTFVQDVTYAMNRLIRFCIEMFGANDEALALELTPGYPNATLAVDLALWEVAQLADRSPKVRRAFLEAPPDRFKAPVAKAGGEEVVAAFDACLARYGWQAQGWDVASPTWNEQPEVPLALMRRMLLDRVPSPESAIAAAAERRDALVRDLEQRLPMDADRQRFHELQAPMAVYVAVREGRALWQLTTAGSLRGALLRQGGRLVREGRIASVGDVWFLLPEELASDTGSAAAVLAERISQRRQEWESWKDRQPPATIGGTGSVTAVSQDTGAPVVIAAKGAAAVVRGIGASRGSYTGRARVMSEPGLGTELAVGEVLVCVMTTPAWTPLFAVAGAIVTDSGGILSHPSIAAREYGIPAVVGAKAATTSIPDGALVTVDGAAGTVTVLA